MVIRSFIALFNTRSHQRVGTPHLVLSRNASDRNFEMTICCRINFKKGSFDWKLKGLLPFLIVKNDWRANNPSSHAHHFSKHIQSNSDIVILFSVIEKSGNYAFEDDKSQGKGCKFCLRGI